VSVVANPRLYRDVGGRRMNIRDQEFTPEGTKVVFADEFGTDGQDDEPVIVYSARVVNGFVDPNTVKVVDDGGGAMRLVGDFPNTAEWSRCAGGDDWVYYSYIDEYRVPGAGPAYIRRRVEGSPEWEAPVMGDGNPQGDVSLDTDPGVADHHRFVALSTASSVLEERLVAYLRMPIGTPFFEGGFANTTWCWFSDDGSGDDVVERVLYPLDPTISILSSLVRFTPDFPGMVSMVRDDEGLFRLDWLMLQNVSGGPSYVAAELHQYLVPESRDAFALSVGVRRVERLDTPGERVWCAYVVFQGPQGSYRSWVDSFLVGVSGPVDVRVPVTPPDPTRVRVIRSRRIEPRLDPSFCYINDDENFDHPLHGPSVSVTASDVWGQNSLAAPATMIYSLGLMPEEFTRVDLGLAPVHESGRPEVPIQRPAPVSGQPPDFYDLVHVQGFPFVDGYRIAEPLEAQAPSFLVEAAPSDGQLADPETVTLGAQVYVFYTRVWGGGDQLFRASVAS
jgi:hypothetical protein